MATTFFARARAMVLKSLVAAFFLSWLVAGIYLAIPPPKGGYVKWRAVEGAATAAAAEHKPILYDFSAAWCGPCQQMERDVFANKDAADLINSSYVPVRVDDDDKGSLPEALREQFAVASLPTLLVIHGPKGEPRRLQGYPGKRASVAFLKAALAPTPPAQPDPDDETAFAK